MRSNEGECILITLRAKQHGTVAYYRQQNLEIDLCIYRNLENQKVSFQIHWLIKNYPIIAVELNG